MEDKELEELLKLDIPNIEGNKDKVLEACKASKNKYNKRMIKLTCVLSSSVIVIAAIILGIILINNKTNTIAKINRSIDNLEYIDNDEEKIMKIIEIEKDIQTISADKQEKLDLSKLSYEENTVIDNLKKSARWNDCLNLNTSYISLDKIFNQNEIVNIRMMEGRYSSVIWTVDKAFYKDLLSRFDLPYIDIIDKIDFFHSEYNDILSEDYNNEYTFFLAGADDSRAIQIRVYDSGYILIGINERYGAGVYDVELKSLFISLIPLEKVDFVKNYVTKEYEIKQSYIDAYLSGNYPINNILIQKYYGNYNGYDVVLIKLADHGDTGLEKNVVIGSVTFSYRFSNREILLWTGNTFYKLSEAYEKGLVTDDDLALINEYHNKKWNIGRH